MITRDRLKNAVKGKKPVQAPPAIVAKQTKALAKINANILPAVQSLKIVTQEDYAKADELLGGIMAMRKEWHREMYGEDGKSGPIPLQKAAIDALYLVNRNMDRPLEEAEAKVKGAMNGYKVEEARLIREAEEKTEKAAAKVREEAARVAVQVSNAATSKMRERLELKRLELEAKATEIEAQDETPATVAATNSNTRLGYDWKPAGSDDKYSPYPNQTHMDILKAIIAGKIPMGAVILDTKFINFCFKEKPEEVMEWPGFEVYETVQTVGRSGH